MSTVVSEQTLAKVYKEVLREYKDHKEFLWKHRGRFVHYIQTTVVDGLLDARLTHKHFRLERTARAGFISL